MSSFTERASADFGGPLRASFKGMIVGLVLLAAAFVLLWLNEGYAVRTARSLAQGAGEVASVEADRVNPANEGRLVHVAGLATTTETVADPLFNVSANAIRLERKVEMYQWKETSSTRSGGSRDNRQTARKTYRYELVWSERPIDSSKFKQPDGHENPPMPLRSASFPARHVTLGAFRLNAGQAGRLKSAGPVDISSATLPDALRGQARPIESGFQTGNPESPQPGDLRILFNQVRPCEATVVARQSGDSFGPFRADAGGEIDLVEMGTLSAAAMFDAALRRNTLRTWILRGVGLALMVFGLALLFGPLTTLGGAVPLLGGMVRRGVGLLSFALGLCLALLTIATAWIAHRPLLGAALAGTALLIAVVAIVRLGRRAPAKARAAGAR